MISLKQFISYSIVGLGLATSPQLYATDDCAGGDATAYGCDMPKQLVSGNPFPVPSDKIEEWINYGGTEQDSAKIIEHSWAIWAALNDPIPSFTFTAEEGQNFKNYTATNIERFLTWSAPHAIARGFDTGTEIGHAAQLHHNAPPPEIKPPLISFSVQLPNQDTTTTVKKIDNIVEGVLYSPESAMFAAGKNSVYNPYNLNLLVKQNLEWVLSQGVAAFPDFPPNAVNIKPVFKHLQAGENTMYQIPVWTGLPETPKPYGEDIWPDCVSIST